MLRHAGQFEHLLQGHFAVRAAHAWPGKRLGQILRLLAELMLRGHGLLQLRREVAVSRMPVALDAFVLLLDALQHVLHRLHGGFQRVALALGVAAQDFRGQRRKHVAQCGFVQALRFPAALREP